MSKSNLASRPPLPTRDGVGASCIALPRVNPFALATAHTTTGPFNAEQQFPAGTIAEFLAQQFPAITTHEWARRIHEGQVVDEHGVAVTPTRSFQAGLKVYYYRTLEHEPRIPFEEVILFQDEHLVVVDKPHFLPVIPSGRYVRETLLARLKRRLGVDSLVPIHRIDRDTAGVIVFSARESTRGAYQRLFATRKVRKTYEAVAPINPALTFPLTHESCLAQDEHFMRMKEVAGESNSITHIDMIRRIGCSPSPSQTPANGDTSAPTPSPALAPPTSPPTSPPTAPPTSHELALYQLRPITGRKHQLRVHCAALGMPIVNDPMYPEFLPETARDTPEDFSNPLQLLARSIEFNDPITHAVRSFTSARQLQYVEQFK